ncbi:MAG: 1-(5-phosphoribosyl)-5-[(5-phosphoribosylamino)methylideneamino]imidazole-4-carboxamide isomerase [Actinobacteria bacterium]|nr:1-(5-phosphoribosyl)-5-[(5-phosphoribosylamino)methylideneamino]imidazole-4-carboxamide isomerase [Actinomycetota bacterium]NIS34279.1 1-(5-phosphoribosyl)-5-[(5-phosphoribosylamino)methylideneamino]imidazole-4-carboxamide isomerase [Actinomycetota bacterium]NIT97366.1 1-(5-phosphoribosyl)-5-[(5-phosphoribosylamino)methylideneamino]imidazole-4-carboxamide isomerase [Actinomycetota bacterium]NIU21037.1 1-(5-phosphoribosyl)-5-[(5-phosphoribosylamino)methylideneamino]imidazole-4-carboxamide isom
MDLYPAIDLRGGRCVRLYQGDYGQETVYGDDPVAQAVAFARAGAGWIHVVDLDAARSGVPENRTVVAAIAAAVDVPVQAGGGVRSVAAAEALFGAGVERVVIGTAALREPEIVHALARDHRVAVGLDGRAGEVATDGWVVGSGRRVLDVARSFADAGVDAFVVTDIARDGTLAGPDVEGLREMVGATPVDVVASGGVGSLDDLVALAAVEVDGRRLSGVIAGKALYEGCFGVGDALEVLSGAGA